MASNQVRGKYTTEFKLEEVRQVKARQTMSAVAKDLNTPKASLSNWVRQCKRGELGTVGNKHGRKGTDAGADGVSQVEGGMILTRSHGHIWTLEFRTLFSRALC